jgi:flagellin-like protein
MKIFRRKDEEAVSPVIAIILMVAITVVLASVLYVWVMNLADTGEEAAEFPTITVTIKRSVGEDENRMIFSHTGGDPIKWEDYRIIIRNSSATETDTVTLSSLVGELKLGEPVIFTDNATAAAALTGGKSVVFGSFDFTVGQTYKIEIYDLDQKKIVWDNKGVSCTALT